MARIVGLNLSIYLVAMAGIQGLHLNVENGRSGSSSQEAGKSLKYIPLNSLTLLKHHKLKTGEETTTKLWWENLPEKRKDKNKIIMQELDKLTEAVPNWPWLGSGHPSSQSSMSATEIPALLQSSLMPYDLNQVDEAKVEKLVSDSGEILGDIIAPMRTAVSVQPVDPASSRDDLIDLEDIAPFSLNEEKRFQAIKTATEDPKVRSSPWPWMEKNAVKTETNEGEVDDGQLPDWSWLINKFGKTEVEDQVTATGSPSHVAKTLESTEAELDETEVDSTTTALFPEWFLNAFGSTNGSADIDTETTTLPQLSEQITLKLISEDIDESTTKNSAPTSTTDHPPSTTSTILPPIVVSSSTSKPKLPNSPSTQKPFNVTANLRKVSANEKSDFVRPSPKVKLHANRVYFNRPTVAPFSSAEPVIKLDPQSIAPHTGKPNSGFDLNFFPLKSMNTSAATDGAKFPSLSQFEKESSTKKVEIPPHSAAETRETFDHLTSLYTSSPVGQSMYKNKVASAIFVAEGKPGVQSKIQGVNIEMKDHESVPFKVNDTKTESVNGDPTMKSPTENLTSPTTTAPTDEKPPMSDFYQNPVKVETILEEIVTDEPTSASPPIKENVTPVTSVAPVADQPSGILEHIRKLLELNNGLIETLQTHLSDQKKILGHILDAASTKHE